MRPGLKVGTVLIFFLAVVGLLGFYFGKPSLDLTSSLSSKPLSFERQSDTTTPWIEQVSWSPRIFVYHNILSPEECQEIIAIAQPSSARTSSGVFLGTSYMKEHPLLRNIERRAEEHGEVFYLLRYEEGQQYKPHWDYFSNDETGKSHIGSSGNRIATVLFYLGSPEEGGETIFPNAEGSPVNITTHETKGGSIEVKANAGDAVLFWDYTPDNKPDPRSLHGGKPVLSGVKWAMTKWIRERPTEYSWRFHLNSQEKARLDEEELQWLKAQA